MLDHRHCLHGILARRPCLVRCCRRLPAQTRTVLFRNASLLELVGRKPRKGYTRELNLTALSRRISILGSLQRHLEKRQYLDRRLQTRHPESRHLALALKLQRRPKGSLKLRNITSAPIAAERCFRNQNRTRTTTSRSTTPKLVVKPFHCRHLERKFLLKAKKRKKLQRSRFVSDSVLCMGKKNLHRIGT